MALNHAPHNPDTTCAEDGTSKFGSCNPCIRPIKSQIPKQAHTQEKRNEPTYLLFSIVGCVWNFEYCCEAGFNILANSTLFEVRRKYQCQCRPKRIIPKCRIQRCFGTIVKLVGENRDDVEHGPVFPLPGNP